MNRNLVIAILLPVAALAVQWQLWPWLSPFVWFLFYPSVFFSARLGGFWAGLISTLLSEVIVWYFFMPPQLSGSIAKPSMFYSMGLFLLMGYLFSDSQRRLLHLQQQLKTALQETYQQSQSELQRQAQIVATAGDKSAFVDVAARDTDGDIINLHGTVQDITGRKQAEAKIRQLNADLERRVLESTAELDSFTYAVSHDLRAPLRAMGGFSQALLEDYSGQLPDTAKTYLQQIELASQQMGELIDGLLALSRNTRGELRHDSIDISALAARLLAQLQHSDPEREVAVSVEMGLQGWGDARMLEVVMGNLLDNAWKYTAHTTHPTIRVYAENRAGIRYFCVADNGAGFDMAHSKRLFQPFQRLHRQDEFFGIGVGLATVQRIVRRHGGVIEAYSEPDHGATFCFSLSAGPTLDKRL